MMQQTESISGLIDWIVQLINDFAYRIVYQKLWFNYQYPFTFEFLYEI